MMMSSWPAVALLRGHRLTRSWPLASSARVTCSYCALDTHWRLPRPLPAATRLQARRVNELLVELATFEGVPEYPKFTAEELIKDGFETSPPWYLGLVAARGDGQLCGYAVFNRAYSSWTGCAFYLEDLYVAPETRGAGVAPQLLQRLCQMALENGVNRMDWHVLESNARARAFYRRLGAHDLHVEEGRTAMRLDRDRIEAVAAGQLLPRATERS